MHRVSLLSAATDSATIYRALFESSGCPTGRRPGVNISSNILRIRTGAPRGTGHRADADFAEPGRPPQQARLVKCRSVPPIRQRHETISQAMLLAAVGGFLDAFTFIRFAVFANAQTGNVVLLSVNAAAGHWHAALLRLAPIGAFVVGVLFIETLARPGARRLLRRPLPIALGVEIAGLLIVSTLPGDAPELAITVTVSFLAAIQFSTFRMMAGQAYATVLTSGNLRSAAVHLHHWVVDRDADARANTARFTKVIAAFAVGALLGGLLTPRIDNRAAAVPSVLLIVVLLLVVRETRRLRTDARADSQGPSANPTAPPESPAG